LNVHSPNTQSITMTDDGNWVENMYEI
jgi:hypothetical protein